MGVTKKMVVECTCDMCKRPCGEYDNRIYYETDSGDRDVNPSYISSIIYYNRSYGVTNGIVCKNCQIEWLQRYIDSLKAAQ